MLPAAPFSIPGFADPFSSLSHLAACLVAAIAGPILVRRGFRAGRASKAGTDPGRAVSLAVFAGSAVVLLAMSGVFHMLGHGGTARGVLQRLDHAAIFVLIAGTFTPTHTIMFRGILRWGVLWFVWLIAALGVVLKSIFFASTPEWLGLTMYLGMGWIGLVSIIGLYKRFGARFVMPLLLGGVVYTIGAVVDGIQVRPLVAGIIRAHEIFHVAVIVGLALHWRFIWSLATMSPGQPGAPNESIAAQLGAAA